MFNKKWGANRPKAAEAAIILDILEHVKDSTSMKLERELIVINDIKLLNNESTKNGRKQGNEQMILEPW